MLFLFFALVSALFSTPGICQESEEGGGHTFCYDRDGDCAPKNWQGQCNTGSQQSPIDIPDTDKNYRNSGSGSLDFSDDCWKNHNFFLENTGHGAEATIGTNGTRTSRCILSGDGKQNGILGGKYVFGQVHFHWGADTQGRDGTEHTINGRSYALEGHFVHYSTKYKTLDEAVRSNKPSAVAVVAVLFDLDKYDNQALTPIIRALKQIRKSGDRTEGYGLNLMKILRPDDGKTYVTRYEGSLTTPDCFEVVTWIVFTYPLSYVSANQLDMLRNIMDNRGRTLGTNVRPTQDINDRKIRFFRTNIP